MPSMSGDMNDDAVKAQFLNGISTWAADPKVLETKSVTLCRATGTLVHLSAAVRGIPFDLEAVISAGVPTTYAAIYMRPAASPSDAEAMKSIQSLCPQDRESTG
jgi:hypothetical protein